MKLVATSLFQNLVRYRINKLFLSILNVSQFYLNGAGKISTRKGDIRSDLNRPSPLIWKEFHDVATIASFSNL
jgi:hypothetical protein